VECDARQPVAALAKSLSAVAAGDVFGPEGGDDPGARFLEFVLEGKTTTAEISAMDAGDEELCEFLREIVVRRQSMESREIVLLLFDKRAH